MGTLEVVDKAIVLADAPANSDVVISLPHSDASRYHTMVGVFLRMENCHSSLHLKKVGLSVTYNTQSSPDVIRTLRTSRVVTVSLPIAVNVEDFFRGKRFNDCISLHLF